MKNSKIYFTLSILFLLNHHLTAQNLISPESWTIGSGSVGIFNRNGSISENIREWGEGPRGKRAILWKAVPDENSNGDGGWNTSSFNIDHTRMYRFSVWIKKTNSTNGSTYLGCRTYPDPVTTLSGNANSNPYFWSGDLPELDKWYLIVGYIHASNDNSTIYYGGIYDGQTGEKIRAITDYKFQATATTAQHRTYLYYDTNTADRQYFYAPRVDMITGDEPSIESLLGINVKTFIASNPQSTTKLGINTASTGNFELAVNGEVRAKEVKVETNWSDFVFEEEYKLPALEEVEDFIAKNGHLPGIPSANEVAKNGIYLGQMDAKLLQKIEELTLYVLQLKKENDSLKVKVEKLLSK